MADKSIHELPVASLLTDDGLLVVYQDSKTQSIRGELIKQYAREGVSQYVEEAKTAAQMAGDAAGEAQAAAEEAKGVALYPPQVNPETGMWQIWDAEQQQYVDTDQKAEGPEGPAGSSIQSIQRTGGTGAPGTTDTYTVTLTNGSTTTFQVYNGADGAGTGDFKADGSVPMTGALQMAGNTISGLPAPAADSDPVRKQDVATLAADRQLSNLDTPQAALMNLGAGVRPNIARNPDFKINQTEFSSTDWKSDYGPDGWKSAGAGHLEYTGGSVTFVNQYLLQFYENGVITAGTYTISALCTGNIQVQLGYWTGDYQNVSSNNYKNGLASVTIQIPSNDDSKLGYIYIKTISDNRSVSFVKLEKGKGQTLAYFDSTETAIMFPQPDMVYSQQLAICQHYQVKLKQNFAVGFADTESTAYFLIPIPVPLRTLPALVYDSLPVLFPSNGVSISAVSVLSNSDCTNSVVLSVSGSGFTPGKIYFIQAFDCLLNANY